MPADADGMTVAELAAERRNLFDGGFHPPLVALDAGALEHNLTTMRDWCERPRSPARAARQDHDGAPAVRAAAGARRLGHQRRQLRPAPRRTRVRRPARPRGQRARRPRRAALGGRRARPRPGVPPAVLRRLGTRRGAHGGRARVPPCGRWTSSWSSARPADGPACATSPPPRRSPPRWTPRPGCASPESPATRAPSGTGRHRRASPRSTRYLRDLRALAERLDLPDDAILSAGGSAFFDQVADVFEGTRTVLRSGAYITHDDGFYRDISPLGRTEGPSFVSALHAWAR